MEYKKIKAFRFEITADNFKNLANESDHFLPEIAYGNGIKISKECFKGSIMQR